MHLNICFTLPIIVKIVLKSKLLLNHTWNAYQYNTMYDRYFRVRKTEREREREHYTIFLSTQYEQWPSSPYTTESMHSSWCQRPQLCWTHSAPHSQHSQFIVFTDVLAPAEVHLRRYCSFCSGHFTFGPLHIQAFSVKNDKWRHCLPSSIYALYYSDLRLIARKYSI